MGSIDTYRYLPITEPVVSILINTLLYRYFPSLSECTRRRMEMKEREKWRWRREYYTCIHILDSSSPGLNIVLCFVLRLVYVILLVREIFVC